MLRVLTKHFSTESCKIPLSRIVINSLQKLSTGPSTENVVVKKGVIAKKIPKRVFLKEDKEYAWCSCGFSRKQPFCDGSHKTSPTELKPILFKPEKSGNYFLCRCKQTNNRPYCDLTHIKTFIPAALRDALKIKL
ncbi:CDGSH iron-sulfur domain-containing protein 3, mitochondrial-like [Centruroides sculpturatus]|uniref:CDGSH iron-sulfur domain-containing protein 3, mitochondrial-like n=1 Tax=Centruroides sculpturatus TaxID=218467 RepID=UPI000C6E3331|nr:CDGSH iron-sulfur domain-containing protein 3, mitochondrial-like [Centruroides sculpturatus]XP_023220287.1 CDGSH iron-sulfur domain-containing protein 3, mitochondrial-like [Centruroides sculpturatus]XP_023220288.1 CDGSH iron-sulfur domain-containing protein 3, mitochondrial-like [Centruroides sculpturatus]XP_023220289.1 CDGSH iron-sulfur domain-containing protein 3, mitochondrial-like [Centruroides sculpturatus]